MKKLIHYNPDQLGRLVCDAPGCGYKENEDRPLTADLIGTKCPNCGASLLTQEDYILAMRVQAFIEWLNKWFGWLGSERASDDTTSVNLRVKVHKKVKITIKK